MQQYLVAIEDSIKPLRWRLIVAHSYTIAVKVFSEIHLDNNESAVVLVKQVDNKATVLRYQIPENRNNLLTFTQV